MAKDTVSASVPVEEQPYPVPANWRWVKLNTVCAFEHGITFSKKAKESGPRTGNLPCLRTANVQESLTLDNLIYIDESVLKGNQNKRVRVGDIIFSSANSRELVGKSVYIDRVPFPMTFGGFVLNIRSQPFIIAKFLFWFLRYEFLTGGFFTKATQTTNIANINTKILGNYAFPFPPLAEQERIVERIESLFTKLDGARDRAQAVLDGYEYRRAAILHKAFTGELTAKWRAKHGVSPESWKTVAFRDVAEVKSNLVSPFDYPDYPHIAPDNIEKKTGVLLDYRTVSEDGVKSAKHLFHAGQILYSKIRPNLSKVVIVDFDGLCSADMYPIEPKPGIDAVYLWYYMLSGEFLYQASTAGSRSLLPKINQKELSGLKVRITDYEEQQVISRIIRKTLDDEWRVKESAERVLETVGLMKKAILGRAFRGLLGTNCLEEGNFRDNIK